MNLKSYHSGSKPIFTYSVTTIMKRKPNDVCIFLNVAFKICFLFLFSDLFFFVFFLILALNEFFAWRNSVEFLFSLMLIMHSGTTERMFQEINNSRNLCVEGVLNVERCTLNVERWMLNVECWVPRDRPDSRDTNNRHPVGIKCMRTIRRQTLWQQLHRACPTWLPHERLEDRLTE